MSLADSYLEDDPTDSALHVMHEHITLTMNRRHLQKTTKHRPY